MINSSLRAVALAAVFSAVAVSGIATANAAGFDGPWTVTISTSRGECGTNSFGVNIVGGRVHYAGSGGVRLSGSVSGGGGVSVSVSDRESGRHASGSGRLHPNGSGGGSWSGRGPTGSCAGSWSAQRSG